EAQAVFAQLSVFPASFARAAATAVVDGAAPGALDTTLSLLHRLCLLDYDPARERFDQHDLLRCYGLAQLADVDAVRERYGSYAIGMVAQAAAQLQQSGDAALAGLDLFDAERAHIDASWRWAADGTQGERSDQLLLAFLEAIGYLHVVRFVGQRDFVAVLEATRAAAVREGRRDLEQVALTDLGWAYAYLDQPEAAVAAYTEARAIARERADLGGEVLILTNLANIAHGASNATGALVHAEAAVTLARRADQPQMLVQALLTRGWILVTLRQLNVAHVAYREARSVARALGDARLEAHVLMQLGDATLGMGDRGQATHHSRAALRIAERIGDWHTRIYATKTLGDIAYVSRAPRDAIGQYEQALATSRAVGEAVSEATLLRDLGDAYHALHDLDRAAASYEAAAVVCEGLGDERGRAVNCWNQGRVLVEQGEVARGVALMQERVDLERRLGHPDADKHAAEIAKIQARQNGATGR
ncbi:MAG: hypothetical protein H7Y32_16290, partial [Chloroflexales bacterium]|nr:hypothetical protein [Chloroflexales bacterium]